MTSLRAGDGAAPAPRWARRALVLPVAALAAYAVLWLQVTPQQVGRSDFTSTYVGGTLFREDLRSQLYDESVQGPLHAALIAPDREGNLPFVDAPVAAALVAPVTLLPLDSAYRVWSLLQLGLLVGAVLVVLRSAPWPAGTARIWKMVVAATALAAAGTLQLLLQAQWTSVSTLGLALAYHQWVRGRRFWGALLLVVTAGIAKPHLALGLVAFMLGWRDRRLWLGAGCGAAAVALASLGAVWPAGIAGFIHALGSSSGRWDYASFVSFVGTAGTLLGNGAATAALGYAGVAVGCALAWWAGSLLHEGRLSLEVSLAAATVLSVLAAPHALPHDLVLLVPALAWLGAPWLGWLRRGGQAPVMVGVGVAVVGAAMQLLVARGSVAAGAVMPLLLVALVVLLLRAGGSAGRLLLRRPLSTAA